MERSKDFNAKAQRRKETQRKNNNMKSVFVDRISFSQSQAVFTAFEVGF